MNQLCIIIALLMALVPLTSSVGGGVNTPEPIVTEAPATEAPVTPAPANEAITPYLGTWIACDMEMDGMHFSPETLGVELTAVLDADGAFALYSGEPEPQTGVWQLTDAGVLVDDMLMILTDEGTLTAEEDGIRVTFYKEGTEKPETAAPQPVGEVGAPYVGEWTLVSLSMDGSTFSAADFGMEMSLTLNADGTFAMVDVEGEAQSGPWTADENGASLMGMMPMTLDADGRLVIEEDGAQMIFVRAGEEPAAPAQPETADFEIEAESGLVTAYTGAGGEVAVPDVIGGVAVTGFADWFFNANTDVTALTLPAGVRALRYFGNDMSNLRRVTLPDGLLLISTGCFQSASALEEITIPAGVRYIGDFFLSYADSLKTVTFEGECPVIMDAFQRVPEDVVAYVPDDQLEAYREVLAELGIEDVRPSGKTAPERETQFSRDDFEFAAAGIVTAYTGSDAVVEIPAEIDGSPVRAIGPNAFANDQTLLYLALPEGLETVGENAFLYSTVLYVDFPATLKTLESGAFYSGYQGGRIDLNEGLEEIGAQAFAFCPLDNALILPEGLKAIGASAFEGSILIDEVYFPASVERIGEKAFYDCMFEYASFAGYDVPEIEADAFGGRLLESLTDIDTPWDLSREKWEIYKAVFEVMDFEDLTVWRNNPSSALDLTHAEADWYDEEGYLTRYEGDAANVTVYSGVWHGDELVPTYGVAAGAFKGNQTVRTFYPHHCDWFYEIGDEAFADSTLTYIELFDSISSIGAGAFRNCIGLTELILPEFLEEIGEGAFEGCTGLEKVTVLCDLSLIPDGSFADCPVVLVSDEAADDEIAALNARLGREGAARARRISDPEPQSVGEAGAPYVGTWIAYELVLNGQPYDVNSFGGTPVLTLREDGTGGASFDGSAAEGRWYVNEDGAYLDDGTALTFTEEGYLVAEMDGSRIAFYREGAEPPAADLPQPQPVGEAGAPYVGEWELASLTLEGTAFSAADFGMTMTLTLNEDGTFTMVDPDGEAETGPWTADENGASLMGLLPMTLDESGQLVIEEDGDLMIFVRAGGEPAPAVTEAPVPAVTEAPAPAATEAPAPAAFDPLETRLVCTKASSSGFSLDPSMLGGEYAILLHADGTADFTVAGMEVKGLPWVKDGNDYVADYYGVMELRFVPVGESLELDYAGSLLLTFTRP